MTDPVVDALAEVCSGWQALPPPNRVSVSAGAAEILKIKRPGGSGGYWNPAETPYMVEPMDMTASRLHEAVCFVGPSQCGKTVALGEGVMANTVVNDPGDMLMVQMTKDLAHVYSRQRIGRAILNSPKLREMQGAASRDDNLHDKAFKNGVLVRIAYPTNTNFASASWRIVYGTDYDRWDDDIGGEGDGFSQMGNRPKTFLSRGIVIVESSPGRPVTDPNWQPASPHEAPPCTGVLGIYNRSDRRRWYWKCPHCGDWFEAAPGLKLFGLPSFDDLVEEVRFVDPLVLAKQYARVVCPNNGCVIAPSERSTMQAGGRWLADGLTIDSRDRISGTPRGSKIAGYWLGGCAAAYLSWQSMVQKYLSAVLEYALTGSELPLQTTTNTDQGAPYMSRHLADASERHARALYEPGLQRYVVPDDARFLVAFVDVQGGRNARFEVGVMAVGMHKEQWLIDRYAIKVSERAGLADDLAPLDPASHAQDWDLITKKVVQATYRTNVPGREMRVRLVLVDSGGEDGVSDKAYAWWRRLRSERLHRRVRLTKGEGGRVDWHVRESMVGGAAGEGDVPLLRFDPNKFKDMVLAGRQRAVPGPGYYHLPAPRGPENPDGWLPQATLDELDAETRGEDGKWVQNRARNETLDIAVGVLVGCMDLGCDRRDFWQNPPDWALPHSRNSEVISSEQRRDDQRAAAAAAAAKPARLERRVARSSYLR